MRRGYVWDSKGFNRYKMQYTELDWGFSSE
jgi:hypothetical protein